VSSEPEPALKGNWIMCDYMRTHFVPYGDTESLCGIPWPPYPVIFTRVTHVRCPECEAGQVLRVEP